MKTIHAFIAVLFSCVGVIGAATPPPYERNPFSTNVAGTPVIGTNNITITNQNDKRWEFFGSNAATVARLQDITNSGTGQFILKSAGSGTNTLLITPTLSVPVTTNIQAWYDPGDVNGLGISVKSNIGAYNVWVTNGVGIGTYVLGAYKLAVNGETYAVSSTLQSGVPFLYFVDTAGDDYYVLVDTNSFMIRNDTDGRNDVLIDGIGLVGIGTNIPQERLHVVGTGRFSTNVVSMFGAFFGNGAGLTNVSGAGLTGTVAGAIQNLNGKGTNTSFYPSVYNTNPVTVYNNVGGVGFIVTSNGNVGVNTPNPTVKLTVTSGAIGAYASESTTPLNCGLLFLSGYNGLRQDTSQRLNFDVYNGGASKSAITIAQSGNVGIGTNDPQVKLHVADLAANSNPEVRISNDAQAWALRTMGALYDRFEIGYDVNNNKTPFWIAAGQNDNLLVLTNNRIGIGTGSPGASLDVYGNIRGSHGSATCSTGVVTVATSASTNKFTSWYYTKVNATIGIQTNTTFWVTNSGDYEISFGARIGGANGNELKLLMFTNDVHCDLAFLQYTATATALDETGFKEVIMTLPDNCRIDMRVANSAAANTTVDNACLNIKGAN